MSGLLYNRLQDVESYYSKREKRTRVKSRRGKRGKTQGYPTRYLKQKGTKLC